MCGIPGVKNILTKRGRVEVVSGSLLLLWHEDEEEVLVEVEAMVICFLVEA